jgi:hypothetical protein
MNSSSYLVIIVFDGSDMMVMIHVSEGMSRVSSRGEGIRGMSGTSIRTGLRMGDSLFTWAENLHRNGIVGISLE